jgi:peroxiredoxin
MALTYSEGIPIGTQAPDFELPGVDGNTYYLASFVDAKVLVVVFTCNHCPHAQAAEDEFIAIQKDYAPKGVQLVAINSNDDEAYPDDSFEHMVQRSREKKFPFPYLRDETQQVARAYAAACTPDIFVFDSERKLKYNGRIEDLRGVIDSVIAGEDISFDVKPSMGCSIKWKE